MLASLVVYLQYILASLVVQLVDYLQLVQHLCTSITYIWYICTGTNAHYQHTVAAYNIITQMSFYQRIANYSIGR